MTAFCRDADVIWGWWECILHIFLPSSFLSWKIFLTFLMEGLSVSSTGIPVKRLQVNFASKPRSAHSTKMMRYNIIIANCDCLCGLAEDTGSLGFAFSFHWTLFAQIFCTSQRGVGNLYRRIPSREAGRWVRHKHMAGEMVHETYTNKHSWVSVGSTRRAEVWSVARAFEVKPVCKEPGGHWCCNAWEC